MSKRCPECRRVNEDSRTFCGYCGATLDPHLRLIQDLERQQDISREEPTEKRRSDVNFYGSRTPAPQKKNNTALWVILGLVVVAVVAVWFFSR